VYQFARDSDAAEAWLLAQDAYISNRDLGDNLDAVENLIKKHEAFEKAALAQEDRFLALERLTTVRSSLLLSDCMGRCRLNLSVRVMACQSYNVSVGKAGAQQAGSYAYDGAAVYTAASPHSRPFPTSVTQSQSQSFTG